VPSITQTFLSSFTHAALRLALLESHLSRYHQINMHETRVPEFTLRIDGMHCGSCVRRVNQAIASVPGVVVNEVRVGAARLGYSLEPAPVENVIAALAKAGYAAHLES
jgi:copper chaperone